MATAARTSSRPARRRWLLHCAGCGATSKGRAWFWIAVLAADAGSETPAVVVHCPRCAEERFRYFSLRLRRRRADAPFDE